MCCIVLRCGVMCFALLSEVEDDEEQKASGILPHLFVSMPEISLRPMHTIKYWCHAQEELEERSIDSTQAI